jgi:hypothetical protein
MAGPLSSVIVTGRPESEVALTLKGAPPKVGVGSGVPTVIVWGVGPAICSV